LRSKIIVVALLAFTGVARADEPQKLVLPVFSVTLEIPPTPHKWTVDEHSHLHLDGPNPVELWLERPEAKYTTCAAYFADHPSSAGYLHEKGRPFHAAGWGDESLDWLDVKLNTYVGTMCREGYGGPLLARVAIPHGLDSPEGAEAVPVLDAVARAFEMAGAPPLVMPAPAAPTPSPSPSPSPSPTPTPTPSPTPSPEPEPTPAPRHHSSDDSPRFRHNFDYFIGVELGQLDPADDSNIFGAGYGRAVLFRIKGFETRFAVYDLVDRTHSYDNVGLAEGTATITSFGYRFDLFDTGVFSLSALAGGQIIARPWIGLASDDILTVTSSHKQLGAGAILGAGIRMFGILTAEVRAYPTSWMGYDGMRAQNQNGMLVTMPVSQAPDGMPISVDLGIGYGF